MLNNVMIDLETLGTKDDAHILSIGACIFDLTTGAVDETETFYRVIDWNSQPGRSIDPDTVRWWMKQGVEATEEVLKPGIPLHDALVDFRRWLPAKATVWSNGMNFDIPILRHAYNEDPSFRHPPWHWTKERDVRTVVAIAKGLVDRPAAFDGVKHHALHDAIHQAKYISAMVMALRGVSINVAADAA